MFRKKGTAMCKPGGVNRIAWHDAVIAHKAHTWWNEKKIVFNFKSHDGAQKALPLFMSRTLFSRKMHFDAFACEFLTNYELTNEMLSALFGVAETKNTVHLHPSPTISSLDFFHEPLSLCCHFFFCLTARSS